MLFLLDTNAFSDLMFEKPTVLARANAVQLPDAVVICTIVRGEILHGIQLLQPGRKRHELDEKADRLFRMIACHAIPPSAGDRYAELKIACKSAGVALSQNDSWIAATARALGATIVTRDKDFARIPSLAVEDWSV